MGYVFGDQLDYVRELAPLFWVSLFLFSSCLAYGYYSGSTLGLEVLEEKLESMPDLEGQSLPVVIFVFFVFIFFSNVLVGLLSIVSGLIFGIPTLMINAMNGYYSGGIIRTAAWRWASPSRCPSSSPTASSRYPPSSSAGRWASAWGTSSSAP